MNRILFDSAEITDGVVTVSDVRAEHILDVLHGEVGQTLKTGVVDGAIGSGVIEAIESRSVRIRVEHNQSSLPTWCDLILAPPRPRVMKRLLPQLATLGVGRIVLVGARKVEKDFWGATLLQERNYRPLLIEGLMQAGTTELPKLETRRNFRQFLNDELEALFPDSCRIVAHPYGGALSIARNSAQRVLLAVGPEGGWTDSEVALLEEHAFKRLTLGERILRTDTALIALLARLMV